MASGGRAIESIVLHQVDKMRAECQFLNAKFLAMLVQLARPSPEARLMALRYARRFTATMGRRAMRELRQLSVLLTTSSFERYLTARDEIGGSQWTGPRPAFGESYRELERDLDEVARAELMRRLVLSTDDP